MTLHINLTYTAPPGKLAALEHLKPEAVTAMISASLDDALSEARELLAKQLTATINLPESAIDPKIKIRRTSRLAGHLSVDDHKINLKTFGAAAVPGGIEVEVFRGKKEFRAYDHDTNPIFMNPKGKYVLSRRVGGAISGRYPVRRLYAPSLAEVATGQTARGRSVGEKIAGANTIAQVVHRRAVRVFEQELSYRLRKAFK